MTKKTTQNSPKNSEGQRDDDPMINVFVLDVLSATSDDGEQSAPEWIKLAPRGRFTARDGRTLEVIPEELVARFDADGIDIAIDLNHATASIFNENAEAYGWITKLEAREDGLYGKCDWLENGLKILAARTHRYISPTLKKDDFGKAIWLHSAALVATPAISMPHLSSASTEDKPENELEEPNMYKAVLAALGVADDASEKDCLSAIGALTEGMVDKATHDQTVETLKTTQSELSELRADTRKNEVNDLLEGALKAKKITPAQREHYEKLCASDDGLETVKSLFSTASPILGDSGLGDKEIPNKDIGDDKKVDVQKLAANARAKVEEAAARGTTLSYDAAFDAAEKEMSVE